MRGRGFGVGRCLGGWHGCHQLFLSGTVGVAAVTAGPGLTNTVTAVKNAQVAQSPVLLLGGAASTLLQVPSP
jgi:thiamine pyrophosphate-dependent acetolactate synthase large subunit-like protein